MWNGKDRGNYYILEGVLGLVDRGNYYFLEGVLGLVGNVEWKRQWWLLRVLGTTARDHEGASTQRF